MEFFFPVVVLTSALVAVVLALRELRIRDRLFDARYAGWREGFTGVLDIYAKSWGLDRHGYDYYLKLHDHMRTLGRGDRVAFLETELAIAKITNGID